MYNFDEIIDRRNTGSLKYDFAARRGKPSDLLPMWVADMDFRAPQCVSDALIKAAQHGIFGYTDPDEAYKRAVIGWFTEQFGYAPNPKWLAVTPGVVFALATAVKAFTRRGDAILIQRPVYYPFTEVITDNDRTLINSPLVYSDGGYSIDFDDFEAKIRENSVKMFILCSPHNPVGRVWSREELTRLAEICAKYGVIIVSDEIHCDFVYGGNTHTILSDISPEIQQRTVLCTAPSKTFNLAGLQVSNIFIADDELRRKFLDEINRCGYSQANALGLTACRAAYEGGLPWVRELRAYLAGNFKLIRETLASALPTVTLIEPQGTYLAWLDFNATALTHDEINRRMLSAAKLWLDEGTMFGPEGSGFMRINTACPRSVIADAMERIVRAFR